MVSVPFIWDYYDKKFNMNFNAGFTNVTGFEFIKPEIGWSISHAKDNDVNIIFPS